jgi:tetratricopeptide (TPR) repeat protein
MIIRKRLLIDLLIYDKSSPRERTIPEISGRLKIQPNHLSQVLKELQNKGLLTSSSLVSHPSCRRKVKSYTLSETGKKEAELLYELAKKLVILVKGSNDDFNKVTIEDLPETLGYDIKNLSSIISLIKRNVLTRSELEKIPHSQEGDKNYIGQIREIIEKIHAEASRGQSVIDNVTELLKIKDEIELEISVQCRFRGDYKKAIFHCKNVLSSAIERKNYETAAKAGNYLGSIYYDFDTMQQAWRYFVLSLKFASKTHDKKMMGKVLMGMSGVQYTKGEFRKAISSIKKAIIIHREHDDKIFLANAYGNLGLLYETLGNFEKAMESCEENLKLSEQTGDKRGIAIIYGRLGKYKLKMGKYSDALKMIEDGVNLSHKIGFKWALAYNYCYLAEVHMKQNNVENATKAVKNALNVSREIGLKETMVMATIIHANILMKKMKWNRSLRMLDDAMKIAKKIKDPELLCEAYLYYGLIQKRCGNIQKAKRYFNLAKIYPVKKVFAVRKIIKRAIRELNRIN